MVPDETLSDLKFHDAYMVRGYERNVKGLNLEVMIPTQWLIPHKGIVGQITHYWPSEVVLSEVERNQNMPPSLAVLHFASSFYGITAVFLLWR